MCKLIHFTYNSIVFLSKATTKFTSYYVRKQHTNLTPAVRVMFLDIFLFQGFSFEDMNLSSLKIGADKLTVAHITVKISETNLTR